MKRMNYHKDFFLDFLRKWGEPVIGLMNKYIINSIYSTDSIQARYVPSLDMSRQFNSVPIIFYLIPGK